MKKYPEYKNLDLVKIAEEILTSWERNDTFKKSIKNVKRQKVNYAIKNQQILYWKNTY